MEPRALVELLSETELHTEAVGKLVDRYTAMESHLERGNFTHATEQVERFCKAYVHLLNIELGEPLEKDTDVDAFIRKSRHDEIETSAVTSVTENIPDMLSAAVATLRQRAAESSELEASMNRADARVVAAISAWLITELVRLYAEVETFDEIKNMDSLIEEQIAATEEQQSPDLVRSRYEFDSNLLNRKLDGVVYIVRESKAIAPGPQFPDDQEEQITALLLARLVAYDMEFCEEPGVNKSWLEEQGDHSVTPYQLQRLDFVFENADEGGYYIPGFRVEEALEYLDSDS